MAPQHHLMLDPEILAAVVRTRIEHRCRPAQRSGARRRVATPRPDNPFLVPTPPEELPWTKLRIERRRVPVDRKTTLFAAIVWAMLMGFVAVAYALHAPLPDFPSP